MPLGQLRAVLDELVDAGVLDQRRREGIEFPIWSTVHGLAVLVGQGPLRDVDHATRAQLEALSSAFIESALTSPTSSGVGRTEQRRQQPPRRQGTST